MILVLSTDSWWDWRNCWLSVDLSLLVWWREPSADDLLSPGKVCIYPSYCNHLFLLPVFSNIKPVLILIVTKWDQNIFSLKGPISYISSAAFKAENIGHLFFLLSRNQQVTSHKLLLWHGSLAGNIILVSIILLCWVLFMLLKAALWNCAHSLFSWHWVEWKNKNKGAARWSNVSK